MPERPSHALLSVVVPCYNEEAVLTQTHGTLMDELGRLEGMDFEIIYVNDGSRDQTETILRELQESDPRVRAILLARNFGHQMAVTAGMQASNGDAVVLIDADLQDPPRVIHDFVARWREGFDVVYGIRTSREGESAFKLATAKAFYRLLNRMSDVEIPLDTGDFRLMDRTVVDVINAMPESARYLRGMVSWVGYRQIAQPYERAARVAGESKYPLFKMLKFATDGLVSFSSTPLKLATSLGLLCSGLALAGILYALGQRLFTDIWVSGWTLLFIAILFFGGVQLLTVGIIGEYVGRIYTQVKMRPLYLVRERLGFSEKTPAPPKEKTLS